MDRPAADRPTRTGCAARLTTSSVPRIEGIGIGVGAAQGLTAAVRPLGTTIIPD
jgi:hypothetical protein